MPTTREELIEAGLLIPGPSTGEYEPLCHLYDGPVLRLDDVGRGAAARHTQAWIAAGRPERAFLTQTFDPRGRAR